MVFNFTTMTALSFYKPKNKILEKYIEGYYFFKNNDPHFSLSYYTFPNNFQIITCASQVEIVLKENGLISKHDKNGKFISTFTYSYIAPIQIDYLGKTNEVTIYFKPSGLNHFVRNLDTYYKKGNFISFFPFDDFQNSMQYILANENIEEAREWLEQYWMGKLIEVNFDTIDQIISRMNTMNVSEISKTLNISRQYLHKIFKAHLGKSPIEFKRIQRFRDALQFPQANLTETGLQAFFYDQSHFIKEMQRFTGSIPKKIFRNVAYKTANPWLIF